MPFVSPGSGGLNTADELGFGPDGDLCGQFRLQQNIALQGSDRRLHRYLCINDRCSEGRALCTSQLKVFGVVGGRRDKRAVLDVTTGNV